MQTRKITVDYARPRGYDVGYRAENNFTLLALPIPAELEDADSYRVYFESTVGEYLQTELLTPADGYVTVKITSDIIPEPGNMAAQLVAFADGEIVGYAPMITGTAKVSIPDGTERLSHSLAAEIALNTAARHTHGNKSVLDKFAELDGKPTYDGKSLGGGSGGASTAEEVSYTNTALPDVANVKTALDKIADVQQTHGNDIVTAGERLDALKGEAHTHANKDILDKLSVSNGKLKYNGSDVGLKGDKGADGTNGITPTIGTNGNWYLGTTDTGEPSRGVAGARGDAGAPGKSGVDGKSAYDVALDNGFSGTTEQWLASLRAPKPVMLSTAQYATETAAVEYMDAQTDKSVVYVWNNKVYCYASKSVSRVTGACLYGYRNSASSGIVSAAGKSTYIIPVSSFSAPLNISNYQHPISNTPYIYGGTTIPTFNKDLIQNDLFIGRTEAFDISAAQLQGCTYVVFAVTTESQPSTASVTVNGTIIPLTVITSPSEIESAVGVETATVGGYIDSGVIYTAIVSSNSAQKYIGERNTYAMPVPLGYCESKVTFEAGTSYLTKYPYATMTQMFSALATANPSYITETVLGKDQSNTYDIKSYVLDAPSSLANGQTSVVSTDKPIFIITAGLHGVEPDAVHTVYHFMQDLAENYYESEQIQYLRDNVKFVIIPICNPWGYANQNYNNSRDVDINKNFAPGYRTNGTSNTGDSAYSEAETQLLKQVFDTYHNAVFHLECHGKYSVDTAFNQTLWFSLMKTLKSELIELNANKINNLIGKRLYNLGYATNKSTGGYITHYALNGRPKDYTGTQYGMLSATMEGTGCIYGETGYSANTQKINCEALENFVLNVFASLNSKIKVYSGDDKNTVATLPRYEGQVS